MTQIRSLNEGTHFEIIDVNDPEFISVNNYIKNAGKYPLLKDWTREYGHLYLNGVNLKSLMHADRKKFFVKELTAYNQTPAGRQILHQFAAKELGDEEKLDADQVILMLYEKYYQSDSPPAELFEKSEEEEWGLAKIFNATTHFFSTESKEDIIAARLEKILDEHFFPPTMPDSQKKAYLDFIYQYVHQAGMLYASLTAHGRSLLTNTNMKHFINGQSRLSEMYFVMTPAGIEVQEKTRVFAVMGHSDDSKKYNVYPPARQITSGDEVSDATGSLLDLELNHLISLHKKTGHDVYEASVEIISAIDTSYNRSVLEQVLGSWGREWMTVPLLENFIEQSYTPYTNKLEAINAWRLAKDTLYLKDKSLAQLIFENKKLLLETFLASKIVVTGAERKNVFARVFAKIMGPDASVNDENMQEFFLRLEATSHFTRQWTLEGFGLAKLPRAAEVADMLKDITLYFTAHSKKHSPAKILDSILRKNLFNDLSVAKQNLYVDFIFRYAHDEGFFGLLYYAHQKNLTKSPYRLGTKRELARSVFSMVDGQLQFVEQLPIVALQGSTGTRLLKVEPITRILPSGESVTEQQNVVDTEIKMVFPIIDKKVVIQIEYARDDFHHQEVQALLLPPELKKYLQSELKAFKSYVDHHLAGDDNKELTKKIWASFPEISRYHFPPGINTHSEKILAFYFQHDPTLLDGFINQLTAHSDVKEEPVLTVTQAANLVSLLILLDKTDEVVAILKTVFPEIDDTNIERDILKLLERLELTRFIEAFRSQSDKKSKISTLTDYILENIPPIRKTKKQVEKHGFFSSGSAEVGGTDKILLYITKKHYHLLQTELLHFEKHYANSGSMQEFVRRAQMFERAGLTEQMKKIILAHTPSDQTEKTLELLARKDYTSLSRQAYELSKPAPARLRK